jgi:uncharacterized protein (TIGR02611 family)
VSEKTTPLPTVSGSQERRGRLARLHARLHANPALAAATKAVVTVVGSVVEVVGVIMMVTPGPALVLIPLGLAILATEWAWAEKLLKRVRAEARRAKERAEAMDPKVRRRRLLLTGAVTVLAVGLVVGYVAAYDWPGVAVDGWDWAQSMAAWLPELPGM